MVLDIYVDGQVLLTAVTTL